MPARTYGIITSVLFAVIGLIHLLRVIFGWQFVIGTWNVPTWLSIVAVVLLGFLSYAGCRVTKQGESVPSKSNRS